MIEKNVNITKREHTFKGFASTYNVASLYLFIPDLQHTDTELAIKNKLKKYFLNREDLHLQQN